MDSWIAKRARTDPAVAASAQALEAEADAFWKELRMVLRQNVEEFNAIYGGQPERLADISEDGVRTTVRLKAEPQVHAEVQRQGLRFLCSFRTRTQSQLAAECLIFGDWGATQVLRFVANGRGAGVSLTDDRVLDASEAAEFVLSPCVSGIAALGPSSPRLSPAFEIGLRDV